MFAAIEKALAKAGIEGESVAAIGIDVPAIVDRTEGTILYGPSFDYMTGYSVTKGISDHYGVPVVADVDTVMAAWGELWAVPESPARTSCSSRGEPDWAPA